MHAGVDVAGGQRLLDLLHEQPLAARGRERAAQPVAGRPHEDELDREAGMACAERRAHELGLYPRQRARAGAQAEPAGDGAHYSSSSSGSAPRRNSRRAAST